MNKYDALIAEAEEAALDWQDCAISEEADLLHRLATALREAQAHVPPVGWRVTEYAREDDARVTTAGSDWIACATHARPLLRHGTSEWLCYPTAAAAMAAIEEGGK